MGKREFITGGVVVLAMAVGFGGMLAARLRKIGDKDVQAADEKGVKDALAAFGKETSASFPSKSSLMDFRDSAPAAAADPNAAANSAAPPPVDVAAQQNAPPAAVDPQTPTAAPPGPPSWANSSPGSDRYGNVVAAPATASVAPDPMTATNSFAPPAATDPNSAPAASGGDPFRRGTMAVSTPGPSADPSASPSDAPPVASSAAPGAGMTWPPTSDAGASLANSGAANTPNSPPPTPQQADPAAAPGMMPLQPLPAAVTAAAAPPAESDPRYDYRRRDYREPASDSTTAIPPAAMPGSTDAQAQYQYVTPAPPANAGPPPGQRAQLDVYGREVNRDPDPTNSDTSTQPAAGQPAYGQSAPQASVDSWAANQPRAGRDGGAETYTLGPNDNYWTISEKVYGTNAYFKAIEEHNRERYPYSDQLRVGDVISTPPVNVLQEKYPDLCPKQRQAPGAQGTALQVGMRGQVGGRVYKVQKGDTLFDIARDELGKASRWAEIYELNRDAIGNDVDMLKPGIELRLPGDRDSRDARDPLTTQSRQPYNR